MGTLNFFDSRGKMLEKQYPRSGSTITLWEPYYISPSKKRQYMLHFARKDSISKYIVKNRNFAIYHDIFVFWYKSLYRFSIYHRNFIEISWFFINISVKLICIDISFPGLIYHFPEYIKKYAKNMRYIFDISEIFWVRKYFFEIIFHHLNFDISENIVFYKILW